MADAPLMCSNCRGPIVSGIVVFLAQTVDGVEEEYPFHEACAESPLWPLYETCRVVVDLR